MTDPSLCVAPPLASTQALHNRPKMGEISTVERAGPLLASKSQNVEKFLSGQNRNNRGLSVHCEKKCTDFLKPVGLSKQ